jgi:hypothetical protein
MKSVVMVAVMPVGPDNNGSDTIESILTYCTDSVVILAVDDSRNPATKKYLETVDRRVVRLESSGYKGIRGALFCSLAAAYVYAIEHYKFEVLFRVDTDALVIGPASETDAITYFKQHPQAGMLGSYKVDCNGQRRDFKIVAYAMRKEYGLRGMTNRERRRTLRTWLADARGHGYNVGEHILGAADFQSYACIRTIYNKGYLAEANVFKDSVISEDHFFSLLSVAAGFELADFATGDKPLGVRWKGLPDAPENLIKQGKKIVHSIKFWEDMNENEIRAYFKNTRRIANAARKKP